VRGEKDEDIRIHARGNRKKDRKKATGKAIGFEYRVLSKEVRRLNS
jgi:hypothetical protein